MVRYTRCYPGPAPKASKFYRIPSRFHRIYASFDFSSHPAASIGGHASLRTKPPEVYIRSHYSSIRRHDISDNRWPEKWGVLVRGVWVCLDALARGSAIAALAFQNLDLNTAPTKIRKRRGAAKEMVPFLPDTFSTYSRTDPFDHADDRPRVGVEQFGVARITQPAQLAAAIRIVRLIIRRDLVTLDV